jgi:hypothetical protein
MLSEKHILTQAERITQRRSKKEDDPIRPIFHVIRNRKSILGE